MQSTSALLFVEEYSTSAIFFLIVTRYENVFWKGCCKAGRIYNILYTCIRAQTEIELLSRVVRSVVNRAIWRESSNQVLLAEKPKICVSLFRRNAPPRMIVFILPTRIGARRLKPRITLELNHSWDFCECFFFNFML